MTRMSIAAVLVLATAVLAQEEYTPGLELETTCTCHVPATVQAKIVGQVAVYDLPHELYTACSCGFVGDGVPLPSESEVCRFKPQPFDQSCSLFKVNLAPTPEGGTASFCRCTRTDGTVTATKHTTKK